MTAVGLAITAPADGAVLVGPAPVDLVGRVDPLPPALAGVALYYRWYAGAHPGAEDHCSLNETALGDPAQPYTVLLPVGTQPLTLAAADQPGQDKAAQNATRNGGVAGGAGGPAACVVHVLRAVRGVPTAGGTLSRGSPQLSAGGSMHWAEPGYQATNRLRYRWRFDPNPADGRRSGDLAPPADALVPDATGTMLVYTGSLPALDLGGYTMRLRVEDVRDAVVGDEAAVAIQVVA